MVNRPPPRNQRIKVSDSSLVASAMYDDAADRIFVWDHHATQWIFEDCAPELWELFMAPGCSPGEFLMNVLKMHRFRRGNTKE